jgi:hypothetical protein
MDVLQEMSRITLTLKAWRGSVMEALSDAKFFSSTPSAGQKWRSILRALIDADKTAMAEILSKWRNVYFYEQ